MEQRHGGKLSMADRPEFCLPRWKKKKVPTLTMFSITGQSLSTDDDKPQTRVKNAIRAFFEKVESGRKGT
jgi:hypothetical protein